MSDASSDKKEYLFAACREGRFADAAASLDGPDDAKVRVLSAENAVCAVQALAESGQVEKAARYYLEAIAEGSPLPAPWMVSAPLRQMKSADLDIACWKAWSERFPDRPLGWIELARSLERAGSQAEAAELLLKASGYFPGNTNVLTQLGMTCLRSEKQQESLAAFQSALAIDPFLPARVKRAVSALLREVVELNGVVLSVPDAVVSPLVLSYLIDGAYESRELKLLLAIVKPEDRILELGAGLGYLACSVGRKCPGISYWAVEADPRLIPVIAENFRLNQCDARLIHGVASAAVGHAVFHAAEDFWASSVEDISQEHVDMDVPAIDLHLLLAELQPTVLVIDIEGGERGLLPGPDLSSVDRVIIELHPDIYGHDGSTGVIRSLLDYGFNIDVKSSGSQVFLFVRG